MRNFITLMIFVLYGCAYTQPVLVMPDIKNLNKIEKIVANLGLDYRNIEFNAKNGYLVTINPLYKDLSWQKIQYSSSDIQELLSSYLSILNAEREASCKTLVTAINLNHKAKPVGMGFDVVTINGNFKVENSCTIHTECKVYAEYNTNYFFTTPSSNDRRYSEAIIGAILKSVVAAKSCES